MDFSVIGPASLKSMGGKTKRAGDTFIALGCSVRTAGKLITELQEKGFLEKDRQGQGKPNRIYLKRPGESFPGRKERNE